MKERIRLRNMKKMRKHTKLKQAEETREKHENEILLLFLIKVSKTRTTLI